MNAIVLPPPPPHFKGVFTVHLTARRARSRSAGPIRLLPDAVAAPANAEDVERLVRWAVEEDIALVPRGAATGMPGGNVGRGVVVDLASFDLIGEVDTAARRLRVGAGVGASRAARAAAAAGLHLPALPSSADRCTVGGMAANNAAGARSFLHGAVCERVVELDVVLATGERALLGPDHPAPVPFAALAARLASAAGAPPRGWPAVRKNASGYAIDRFLRSGDAAQLGVGSEGTLAMILGITLRLSEPPARRAVLLIALASIDDLPPLAEEARRTGASACELFGRRILDMARLDDDPRLGGLTRGAQALLLLEMEGEADAVEEGVERLRRVSDAPRARTLEARTQEERRRLWGVRHGASPAIAIAAERGRVSTQFIEDSVVPPHRLANYLRGLRSILDDAGMDAAIFGHAGDGNPHVNPLVDIGEPTWRERVRGVLDSTADLVAGLGGTLSAEHGDGRLRAPFLERIWPAPLVTAFRDVKDTLDPAGILNPGVILPLPGQDPLEGLLD